MSRENVRVRRTRKLLREALIELIEERGFEAVTVGRVTERAMVSRAAFYRNYRDKYHLVEQIFDDAMNELLTDIDTASAATRWAAFFEHIAAHDRFYRAMLGKDGSSWFATRMRASLSEMTVAHLAPLAATDLVPTVLGGMFVQTITWWLDHGRPVPPAEISAEAARLASAVMRAATVQS
ncbi:TetR/AcrR family transcriptional regulator [Amycolatopsis alkalitolerans]|uniref:TetR/AcrR family transcriptional regulator n=1 Tax=Amycolatopsis alkalitolerans TaxID=2547244 RepID=UPI00190F3CC8|nr:TetR family transcriptional regulator [Amycolatopsis alkalitolerans]